MKPNLDKLKDEIERYLDAEGFVVFHAHSRLLDSAPIIEWNTDSVPDYRLFLEAARKIGASLVVFHHGSFSTSLIEEAFEDLEDADMPRDEKRALERRLRELSVYEGFTHMIELSFDHHGRIYLFTLETDWYEELHRIMEEIQASLPDDDEDGPMGGYFSNN